MFRILLASAVPGSHTTEAGSTVYESSGKKAKKNVLLITADDLDRNSPVVMAQLYKIFLLK